MNTLLAWVYLISSPPLLWSAGERFFQEGQFHLKFPFHVWVLFGILTYFFIPYMHLKLRQKPFVWQNGAFIVLSLMSIISALLIEGEILFPTTSPLLFLIHPRSYWDNLGIFVFLAIITMTSFIFSLIFGTVAYYKTKHYQTTNP